MTIDVMERPMIFNTEMVRAILDGRKTQTRRIVKNQSLTEEQLKNCGKPCYPGDILWVRETWTVWSRTLGTMPAFHYKADGEDLVNVKWHPSIHMPKEAARIFLRVTNVRCERLQNMTEDDAFLEGYGGCPGAHAELPCWVGGEQCDCGYWYCNHSVQEGFGRDIWDKTLKLKDIPEYCWDANPWVWVIEFERIEKKQLLSFADRDSARYGDQGVLMPTT